MAGKRGRWAVWVFLLALAVPGAAQAGPYFGEWGWCWKDCKDCPKGSYCCLHYWVPAVYWLRAHLKPVNLDGYPPGLPVPADAVWEPYGCRDLPPMP